MYPTQPLEGRLRCAQSKMLASEAQDLQCQAPCGWVCNPPLSSAKGPRLPGGGEDEGVGIARGHLGHHYRQRQPLRRGPALVRVVPVFQLVPGWDGHCTTADGGPSVVGVSIWEGGDGGSARQAQAVARAGHGSRGATTPCQRTAQTERTLPPQTGWYVKQGQLQGRRSCSHGCGRRPRRDAGVVRLLRWVWVGRCATRCVAAHFEGGLFFSLPLVAVCTSSVCWRLCHVVHSLLMLLKPS